MKIYRSGLTALVLLTFVAGAQAQHISNSSPTHKLEPVSSNTVQPYIPPPPPPSPPINPVIDRTDWGASNPKQWGYSHYSNNRYRRDLFWEIWGFTRLEVTTPLDKESRYRLRLLELIVTLQKANTELQEAINSVASDDTEKTSKLANKVAKTSYQLRKHLGNGQSIDKLQVNDSSFTLSSEERFILLKELSLKLNMLISQLKEDQVSGLIDVRRLEDSYQQVREVETQALSLKVLTKKS